jgi:hypothetical protein
MSLQNFFYTRTNEWFEYKKIIKLGMTSNIVGRETSYITSEPIRGTFSNIFMVDISREDLRRVDVKMKEYFNEYNVRLGGGTEFYKIEILDKISDFFDKENIKYKKLSIDDIKLLEKYEKPVKKSDKKDDEKIEEKNIEKDDFYDIETCKIKIREYLNNNSSTVNLFDLYSICSELYEYDKKFPPSEKWIEYYKVKNLGELFDVRKKKVGLIL